MNEKLSRLHEQVSGKLEEIAALFTRPSETKITIIIRTPWLSDGGVVITNDSDEEAIAEFRRLQTSPTTTVTPAAGQNVPAPERKG